MADAEAHVEATNGTSKAEAHVKATKDTVEAGAHAAAIEEDTYRVLNAGVTAKTDDCLLPQVSATAETSLFKGHTPKDKGLRQFESAEFDVGQAKAGAWASGLGAGVDASVNLFSGRASVFDGTLGLSASTGGGVKDDSVNVKLLGTGVTVGRKIGISVLGTSIGIDFGRFFK